MKRREVLAGAAAATALSLVPAASAATRLRFAHFSVTDDPNHVAATAFAERVKQRTNGEVEVQIIPNSQLGGEVDVAEGVRLGTVDVSPPSAAVLANWVPEMNVLNMPFAFRDWAHYTTVLDGPLFDEIVKAAAAKGFRVLGFMTSGPRHIMTRAPVNAMADLAGRKIRTVQNPVHVATFNAFGANATAIAYPEVYSSLQTGVVDGGDAANTNYFTAKFFEVAPHWAQVSWLYYTNAIIMSERKFRALPAEQQKIFNEVGRAVGKEQQKNWQESDDKLLDELKKRGVKVTAPDPEPFRAASKKVYEQFLTSDEQKRLFKLISG